MDRQAKQYFEFGPYRIDTGERSLLCDGRPVTLTPKVFDLLLLLVENNGRTLDKKDLMERIWPDAYVGENNLNRNISLLRKVLGPTSETESFIRTVPKRGYRFDADVHSVIEDEQELIVEKRTNYNVTLREEILKPDRASTFRTSLRTVLVVSVVAALVLLGLAFAINRGLENRAESAVTDPTDTVSRPQFRSIAVLPFKHIGDAEESEYLGIGIADTLIARLSPVRQISIRPVSAIHRYTDLGQDPVAAGRELNVDVVLDGRIQQADGRLRATVEMWSVRDAARLWTQTLDVKRADIFTLQDEIALRVTNALPTALSGEELALVTRRHTANADAYEAYLKGRYFWNKRTPEGINKAVTYFERAIELDADYALAWAGLADCYALGGRPIRQRTPFPNTMRHAAMRALELDGTLAEPRAALAYHQGAVDWEWQEAEENFLRAISLNPNYATARHWHAYNLVSMGRLEEALTEIKLAQELDPLSIIIITDVGHILYFSRRYDEAIAQYRKALDMDPNFAAARIRLGEAYLQQGLYQEALAELQRAHSLHPTGSSALPWLGFAEAVAGNHTAARQRLAALKRLGESYNVAVIHAGLGEKDEAFFRLEKALRQHDPHMALIKTEPRIDSLRSDARFEDLLRRMKLGN